jgi:hypothetical protein
VHLAPLEAAGLAAVELARANALLDAPLLVALARVGVPGEGRGGEEDGESGSELGEFPSRGERFDLLARLNTRAATSVAARENQYVST